MKSNCQSPMRQKAKRARITRREQRDATRQKLLVAAIDVFGRWGFDGATTRMLAGSAGVNLQAIRYYFKDKQGLYVAAAEYIVGLIRQGMAKVGLVARTRFREAEMNATPIQESEARSLMVEIVRALAARFTGRESDVWARFMMREMMEPTEAFKRIYDGAMGPGLEVSTRLMAIVLREPPESEHVRLRTLSLVGSVLMFRMARATALAHLNWKDIGEREAALVRDLAPELVAAIVRPNS